MISPHSQKYLIIFYQVGYSPIQEYHIPGNVRTMSTNKLDAFEVRNFSENGSP